jgi:hypothetical protein
MDGNEQGKKERRRIKLTNPPERVGWRAEAVRTE